MVVVIEIADGRRLLGVSFRKNTVTLGRGADADVVLPDPSVFPLHATLRKRGNAYLVFAESAEAALALTEPEGARPVPVEVDDPRGFEEGATLALGRVRLRLHTKRPGEPAIEWVDPAALERRIVEVSLAAHALPHGPKDVTRALRELRVDVVEPLPKERPAEVPSSLDAPSLARDRVLAIGFGVALLLVFAALYWLFREETPLSL